MIELSSVAFKYTFSIPFALLYLQNYFIACLYLHVIKINPNRNLKMVPLQKKSLFKALYVSLCSCTQITCEVNYLIFLGTLFHQNSFLYLLSTATSIAAKYSHMKMEIIRGKKRYRPIIHILEQVSLIMRILEKISIQCHIPPEVNLMMHKRYITCFDFPQLEKINSLPVNDCWHFCAL